MTTTDRKFRYGVPDGEEVTHPELRRSAKKAVDAAATNGWRIEFTRSPRTLWVHLFPQSRKVWEVAEGQRLGTRRRPFFTPVRVDLQFDAETGAFWGGHAFREWIDHENNVGDYGIVGDGITDVLQYIEFPERVRIDAAVRARAEAEAEVRQAERKAVRDEWLADPVNHRGIAKLQELAQEPNVPNLGEERGPRSVMRAASEYAKALIVKGIAERALRSVGWQDEDGNVITVRRAVVTATTEVSGYHETNDTEAEHLAAINSVLNEYWLSE